MWVYKGYLEWLYLIYYDTLKILYWIYPLGAVLLSQASSPRNNIFYHKTCDASRHFYIRDLFTLDFNQQGIESWPQILIFLYLKPDGVNLLYFKLRLFDLKTLIVCNIKGLRYWVAKIQGLENQSLWQILITFTRS